MKSNLLIATAVMCLISLPSRTQTTVYLPNQGRGGVSSVAGRTGAVMLTASDLSDFTPQLSSGQLVVQPGKIRFGAAVCSLAEAMATPAGGTGGPGTGKLYINNACGMILEYPASLTFSATGSGITLTPAVSPSVPDTAFPVADVTISGGAIVGVVDQRAAISQGGTMSHAALSNLDYGTSGHTGFQPALGFTAENLANKDQNGGYTGRDGDGNVVIPGSLMTGSGGVPSKISVKEGPCPPAADAGYDYALCMESGTLYQVSAAGAKSRIGNAGDVVGPATAVSGHLAVFDTDGQHITDGGPVPTGSGGSSAYGTIQLGPSGPSDNAGIGSGPWANGGGPGASGVTVLYSGGYVRLRFTSAGSTTAQLSVPDDMDCAKAIDLRFFVNDAPYNGGTAIFGAKVGFGADGQPAGTDVTYGALTDSGTTSLNGNNWQAGLISNINKPSGCAPGNTMHIILQRHGGSNAGNLDLTGIALRYQH